jgi:hypothetical protein
MSEAQWRSAPDARIARLLAHPFRHRLLDEYAGQVTSPSKVAAALGEPVNVVSYHTGVLLRAGCLELVRTERRRGATEHFYRTVERGEIDDDEWARLPVSTRRMVARRILDVVVRDASDAIPRGGMDLTTTHISRTPLALDDRGRTDLAAVLRSTLEAAQRIDAESRRRLDGPLQSADLVVLHFQALRAVGVDAAASGTPPRSRPDR